MVETLPVSFILKIINLSTFITWIIEYSKCFFYLKNCPSIYFYDLDNRIFQENKEIFYDLRVLQFWEFSNFFSSKALSFSITNLPWNLFMIFSSIFFFVTLLVFISLGSSSLSLTSYSSSLFKSNTRNYEFYLNHSDRCHPKAMSTNSSTTFRVQTNLNGHINFIASTFLLNFNHPQ